MELIKSDKGKLVAAITAVNYIKDGMSIGLGSGSTAALMVEYLSKQDSKANSILGVPTSKETEKLARHNGLRLTTLDNVKLLDLTIDGADECDENYNLIKGGGAALLHEKIVAKASRRVIIIADESKYRKNLGSFPLPVEVIKFGWLSSKAQIHSILKRYGFKDFEIKRRMNGPSGLETDEGNYILDLYLNVINDPVGLSKGLNLIPGVIENGLFIGLCDTLILGKANGEVKVYDRLTGKIIVKRVATDELNRMLDE